MTFLAIALSASIAMTPAAKVEDIVREEMAKRHIPGAQVAVVHHGKMVFSKSFGKCSIQFDLPVKNTTLFTLNSATKPFTGVALMQLVENGSLQLDDPISKYLDGLPVDWQRTTVRELATHVSGLPDIVDQSTGKLVGGLPDDEAWAKVQTLPREFATNTKYSYNQTNYLLLGKLIDKLSGLPFTKYIEQNQFVPLGMKHTMYGDARDVVPQLAQAYRLDEIEGGKIIHRPIASEFPHFLWTAAGLCTTAEDVAKWSSALMSGKLVKQASLYEMWRFGKLEDGTSASWAVGWPSSTRKEHRWVAGIGGGRSAFFIYPEDDLAVVVLTNLGGGAPEEWVPSIARVFVPEIPL